MGMSPQSGLPQNNRVGDFDPFALPLLICRPPASRWRRCWRPGQPGRAAGPERRQRRRARSGAGGGAGQRPRRLALDVFVAEIRRHLGGLLVELGGADVIVFTGGIGENGAEIRAGGLCGIWQELGIVLDDAANAAAQGECPISRRAQPHADLDRADQRRIDRGPAGLASCCCRDRTDHVHRQSHRFAGVDAEGRGDGRLQAAGGRALPAGAEGTQSLATTGRTFVAVDTWAPAKGDSC